MVSQRNFPKQGSVKGFRFSTSLVSQKQLQEKWVLSCLRVDLYSSQRSTAVLNRSAVLNVLLFFQERNVLTDSNVNSTTLSEPNSPIARLPMSFVRTPSTLQLLRNNLQLAPVLCLDRASCWWRIWPRN